MNRDYQKTLIEFQNSTFGTLRYRLVKSYLAPFIKQRPLKIVDFGGANGFECQLYEPIAESISIVDKYIGENIFTSRKTSYHTGNIEDYLHLVEGSNLIFLHNVLAYTNEPISLMKNILKAASKGTVISILNTNPNSDHVRNFDLIKLMKKKEIIEIKSSSLFELKLNRIITRLLMEELLKEFTFEYKLYGVRCIYDYSPSFVRYLFEYSPNTLLIIERTIGKLNSFTRISKFTHAIITI